MNAPFTIDQAGPEDLPALLALYRQLHPADAVPEGEALTAVWEKILRDPGYHILLIKADGALAASVTVVIVQNLTRCASPYAIVENVITDQRHRRRGYAAALIAEAVHIARAAGCYKVSLTTGNKDAGTFAFYESCGFNRADKTAFIRWLPQD